MFPPKSISDKAFLVFDVTNNKIIMYNNDKNSFMVIKIHQEEFPVQEDKYG